MHIDRTESIAGQPILRVRDFLKWLGGDEVKVEGLAAWFKVSGSDAGQILEAIVNRGWLERIPAESWHGKNRYYRLTLSGGALSLARSIPPLRRAKAEALVADFLKRCADVNARDELTHYVHEVRLFGSYLDKTKPTLGDIDIVLDLKWREIPGRDLVSYNIDRAHRSGRRIDGILQLHGYGEIEVRRLLKGNNRYLEFHPPSDLKVTGARSELIFPTEKKAR